MGVTQPCTGARSASSYERYPKGSLTHVQVLLRHSRCRGELALRARGSPMSSSILPDLNSSLMVQGGRRAAAMWQLVWQHGCEVLRQRCDHHGRVGFRHAKPLRQAARERVGHRRGRAARPTARARGRGSTDWLCFAPCQIASLDELEGVGFHIGENKQHRSSGVGRGSFCRR